MTNDRPGEKSSEEIHRAVARTAGAIALQIERGGASRRAVRKWIRTLRGAADDLERRLGPPEGD